MNKISRRTPGILGRLAVSAGLLCGASSVIRAAPPDTALPSWVDDVGAKSHPSGAKVFPVSDFGAVGDGKTPSTAAIQSAIDACSKAGGGTVTFTPGTYLTAALLVKSHVRLKIDKGVTLLGSHDEAAYPILPTRVAGIEMPWPAALINVNGQTDVEVSGGGVIDGQGDFWWKKYWDLRKGYEPRKIRWAADYDCQRVRLIVIADSKDVTLANVNLRRAGFWTVQVLYSEQVTVDGIKISDNAIIDGVKAPSTDGVDIDSSSRVLVQHCDIDNNDDDICLKSGRDTDGLRVNRPTEYVVIRDNICRRGGGVVAFGSETSGGIRHIVAYRDEGIGTSEGIRFKSTHTRGGYIEDVLVRDITLTRVPLPFTFTLDWNPSYSYATIPPEIKDYPHYWKVLATPVDPPERGFVDIRDITIANVKVTGARRILSAAGMKQKPLGAVRWSNIEASGGQAGSVEDAKNWSMENVHFTTSDGAPVKLTGCVQVDAPSVTPSPAGKR
jgi:polygalacturonase